MLSAVGHSLAVADSLAAAEDNFSVVEPLVLYLLEDPLAHSCHYCSLAKADRSCLFAAGVRDTAGALAVVVVVAL